MIRQLKYGDPKVLGDLYQRYRSDFIAWMTKNYKCSREVAREVYQDTMITIVAKAQNGELDSLQCNPKTYIFGVGKNKYKEYLRKNAHYLQVEENAWETLVKIPKDEVPNQNIELVIESLSALGEPCKTVLELYYFHGLSMEEIAQKLPYKNSNTVKNMKYKCLLKLKEIFHKVRVKEKS